MATTRSGLGAEATTAEVAIVLGINAQVAWSARRRHNIEPDAVHGRCLLLNRTGQAALVHAILHDLSGPRLAASPALRDRALALLEAIEADERDEAHVDLVAALEWSLHLLRQGAR